MATSDKEQIAADLAMMCSGNFNSDSLGLAVYDEIVGRARANASRYLKNLRKSYLGAEFDAELQSNLDLPFVLWLLEEAEPGAVRETAAVLLRHFDAVMVVYDKASDVRQLMTLVPDETVIMLERLDRHRIELRRLLAQGGDA